jgi:Transport and Golgi organisation 2
MCTVSFIPAGNRIFLSSNRDEKQWRAKAAPPDVRMVNGCRICFPADGDAGGTWIAAHENGNAAVLLNGAFEAHTPQPPYRRSRGLILLDILTASSPVTAFQHSIDLCNIEPFTLVLWSEAALYECRWDGYRKYCRALPANLPHIWSSATLYGPAVVHKREQWFSDWLQNNAHPQWNDILHFHRFTGDGDAHNDLLMNRNGSVFTVSITSIAIDNNAATFQYLDLHSAQVHHTALSFEKNMAHSR